MTSDKMQNLANMPNRQKAILGIVVLVVLVLIWQVMGMFGGKKAPVPAPQAKTAAAKKMPAAQPGAPTEAAANPSQMRPTPSDVPMQQPLTQREAAIMQMQQETQAKYLEALNELQMLKLARDIAQTNKDISNAKLARVVSEKKIVDLLTPPAPPPVAESLTKSLTAQPVVPQDQYSVVSVSQLQNKWLAVLRFKNGLYNVHVGDVLPADGSVVESIGNDGVVINKDGARTKVSLIPSI